MIKQIKSSIHNFIRGCKGGRGSATESRSWFMVKKYLFYISLYYLCWVTLIGVAKIKANVLVCGGWDIVEYGTACQGKYSGTTTAAVNTQEKPWTRWQLGAMTSLQRSCHWDSVFDDRYQRGLKFPMMIQG